MVSDFRQSLSAEEKAELRRLLATLETFRNLRSTMPLQYVITFLLVCLDEGKGVTEYAKDAGVSQSVMTRHLEDIGDRNRHKMEGFGLITQRNDPLNLRKNQALLTNKGKGFASQLIRLLKGSK